MTLIIGLTGGIASGKSTISSMLTDLDMPVVDADKIAREVVNPGEKAYEKVIQTFGKEVLLADEKIDRKKLGSIIFADEVKRKQLNQIVHPAVREEILKQRDALVVAGVKCVVLDIPLLYESKLTHFVDKTLVVAVDEKVQLERLMKRDESDEAEARQRIQSQIPICEKVALADAVIDNNGAKQVSYEQLEHILKGWNVL
jgi:dephospho-CoA kinase